jgi:putative GTP pyrophosphokinase
MTPALDVDYRERFDKVLKPVAARLQGLISDHLKDVPRIDRVSARAKAVESFLRKAAKVDEHLTPKYSQPLSQIQDQIGARIVVFYKSDAIVVGSLLKQYFRHIEEKSIVPDSQWSFGYFGVHFIFHIPVDAIPAGIETDRCPVVFELQVKTLFQHAWSEAEHDLGYKPVDDLTDDQKRRLAYTSAQAWGADREFQELLDELQQ